MKDGRVEYEEVLPRTGELTSLGVTWLDARRCEAAARFDELGMPTTRLEDWRYPNLARLAKADWSAATGAAEITPEKFAELELPELGGERIVFVDGHHVPELSSASGQDSVFRSLSAATRSGTDQRDAALAHFARVAEIKDDPIAALNTAHARDAAVLNMPRGTVLSHPVHVVFLSSDHGERAVVQFPRLLILAQEGSQASVIIDHVSLHEGGDASQPTAMSTAVSEIVVERNASLRVVLLQREARDTVHLARQSVRQERDSRFAIHTFSLTGAIVRNDLEVVLADSGAECELSGLFLGDAEQVIDNHTEVDHAMPRCTSREFYKGIVSGESRGVFRGRIVVRPDAQKTCAEQHNRNLVISPKAEIDTKPQLEIYADDVQCSHGSSIGQIDPEALFFMRSRGLDEDLARAILSKGFANEITETLPAGPVRDFTDAAVSHRLDDLFPREGIS